MARLAGKVAVVTAAGSGIGRAAALAFAREGAFVTAVDISPDDVQATANLLSDAPAAGIPRMLAHPADVSQARHVAALFERVSADHGRLDVLFCGVGISGRRYGDGPVDECSESGWDHVLSVNLKSAYLCSHHAIPLMASGGSIIFIGSVLGIVGGGPSFATHAYAASKGGLIALSRAMATYYADRRIRVNLVAPGLIETPMSRRAQSDPHLMAHVEQMQPLSPVPEPSGGHLGRPADIAAAAVYLASDESAFVTGVVLPVDGGWTAQ